MISSSFSSSFMFASVGRWESASRRYRAPLITTTQTNYMVQLGIISVTNRTMTGIVGLTIELVVFETHDTCPFVGILKLLFLMHGWIDYHVYHDSNHTCNGWECDSQKHFHRTIQDSHGRFTFLVDGTMRTRP